MNGEDFSAVTIFKMGEGLDDGPIYFQSSFSLSGYIKEIFERIEKIGIIGTKSFIKDLKNNEVVWSEQNESEATTYKRINPSNSEIYPNDFLDNNSDYFFNKVRGLQPPYPEAFIKCKSGKLILEKVRYEKDI